MAMARIKPSSLSAHPEARMHARFPVSSKLLLIAIFALPVLSLTLLWRSAARGAGNETKPDEKFSLGGPDRYLTHLSTDKPLYRPGERVFIRGVMLHAVDHTPLGAQARPTAFFEIRGPKGDVVASGQTQMQDSVAGFAWDVPAEQPGGQYTVKLSFPWDGHPPAERKFDVRSYRAPRLKSQVIFLRDGYGPGDSASATLHVDRAEGGVPDGAKVTAIARVDGVEAFRGQTAIDNRGNCTVRFPLPAQIARGDGTLSLVIEDRGVVETASKTIPILLQTVDLAMYPEGGDLVAGLPSRVYVEAVTPARKPADIAGVVIDDGGTEIARFRTEHEGRGRFAFTPRAGAKYTLKIDQPAGIKTTYPLPAIKESGAVIACAQDSFLRNEVVKLSVASSTPAKLRLTLAKRGVELASTAVDAAAGKSAEISLTPPSSADGVLVATLWDDATGAPLAERLIFRQPAKSVQVKVTPDQSRYVPGGTARLTVTTSDDAGKPLAALVGLSVTDDSVLEMIEKREQAPRLPAMVLLEDDVRELADAHVYLDAANPKSPLAMDLLLGTQGWRRFALATPQKFLSQHRDAALRVLAFKSPPPPTAAPTEFFALAVANGNGAVRGVAPVLDEKRDHWNFNAEGIDFDLRAAGELQQAQADQAGGLVKDLEESEAKQLGRMEQADRLMAKSRRIRNVPMTIVREYAHALRPGHQPGQRADFSETLYWNAAVKTAADTGQASVTFALNDAVSTFRVAADAFSADGALGSSASTVIESVQPFYVEPKLPLEVIAGDVIRLPVALVNGTAEDLSVTLTPTAAKAMRLSPIEPFTLKANARERRILEINTGSFVGACDFVLDARAGNYADRVTRRLVVKPAGFPIEFARGGMLGADSTYSCKIDIPADVVPSSVTARAVIYPTPLANMTEALARLLQEPCGCFEQTTSTTYPEIMAQQYFLGHTGVDAALVQRNRELLDKGYSRLTGFECKNKGYEWFGEDPGHETLTAYGLMEFTDMAAVRQVDSEMLARTRQWLLKTRDGKGGFTRGRRALHTWVEDRDCSNAYILWCLLECGQKDLGPEVQSVKDAGFKSNNSYVVALTANVMALAGENDAAKSLMDKLVSKQTKEGWINGATTSIVGSGGEALQIETTALTILAWLRDPSYAGAIENSMHWLAEACKAGRFGSTQSTVLALRAVVAYDKARAVPKAPGKITILVDGHPMGLAVEFDVQSQGSIQLPDFAEMLSPGAHTIELKMDKGSAMPFALSATYNSVRPPSSDQCKVAVAVALKETQIQEGAVTEANVTVTNRADEAIPTPVAIIGIPGGLEARHDQLKELVKSGRIAAYEVIGRDVVLYWRDMPARQKVELPLSLTAAVPGRYAAPASRTYLYYTDEFKDWAKGLDVEIR
jgi:uncharacterized protein YfaS (alpha-2-macroglobulin family)